jgi:cephalosporin hydroxylase
MSSSPRRQVSRLARRLRQLRARTSANTGGPPIRGVVDAPTEQELVRVPTTFQGWALEGTEPPASVEIILTSTKSLQAEVGQPRPDVPAALGQPDASAHCGWSATVDLSEWPESQLRTRVVVTGGSRYQAVVMDREFDLSQANPAADPLAHLDPLARKTYLRGVVAAEFVEATNNFGDISWMGQPIWQNLLDLWTVQEVICRIRPALLIECGTFKGGSSRFFADLFELMEHGRCITIDILKREFPKHPRVEYLTGGTLEPRVIDVVANAVAKADGPVLVVLDDDHSEAHVRLELDTYAAFPSVGSYLLVQDGIIDTLPAFAHARPGPLPAIRRFLASRDDFVVDRELVDRFPMTHHPDGWLLRVR